MGAAFRADDNKLGRYVAPTIFLDSFTADHDRPAYFVLQEHVLTLLKNWNIGAIYVVERPAAVLDTVKSRPSRVPRTRQHGRRLDSAKQ
jgi:hypothetical protein